MQICSPKLGMTAISVGSHLPFHYWCYWTMVVNMDINLDSSKCQIYLFHFLLLKALDKPCKFGSCSLPKDGLLLVYTWRFFRYNSWWCSVRKDNRCLSYNRTPYDFLRVHSVFQGPLSCFQLFFIIPYGTHSTQRFNIECLLCNSGEWLFPLSVFLMVMRFSANPLF